MFTSLNPGAIGVRVDDLEAGLTLAARHGFAGYHFDISEAAQLGIDKVTELCEKTGVRLSGFGFPLDFRGSEQDFDTSLEALAGLAEVAAALDVRRTATWITPASDDLAFDANFDLHASRLLPAAQILASYDIRLGLEYVGPLSSRQSHRYAFIHNMDQMAKLCAAVGDNVGFLLDAWHWYTAGEDVTHLQRLQPRQVVDVHVNDAPDMAVDAQIDSQRELPGATGVIDITTFLASLKRIGYDGPVMVEPFSAPLREMATDAACAATATSLAAVWAQAGL